MNDFDGDGYARAAMVLTQPQCEHIAGALPTLAAAGRGGIRHLISHPVVGKLLLLQQLSGSLWSAVGRDLVAVNATLFDKTPAANWRVQWHQDRTIAVKDRLDVRGYGPWSTKNGTAHVDAPDAVLAQMVAVRIHLDHSGAENGPLRVIPGTHTLGKLSEREIAAAVAGGPVAELTVTQGSVIFMRPLLVHSSSAAASPAHRRVLHIEFAPRECISPLEWHTAVALKRAA
ncbi:MAG TPA: phytanoyl-CoA dioxygenase family protein [Thermoanaerobaculia bacterium]|jgi:ectoine hydroxylase-related dioxygenase (phytanoyl-CoA dioxygenase family)